MAIRHKNLAIRRDELTVTHVSVAEWEVPLLQLVHGDEMVTIQPGEPWADVDPPAVADEYQRLFAKYKTPAGDDGSPGQRAVALVYGAFGSSPALRHAIQAATFDRNTDLLGLDVLKANAAKANAAAAAANAALAQAQVPADTSEDDEDDESEAPAVKVKAPKKAKAAATPASSLL